jgi:hypothetical protein
MEPPGVVTATATAGPAVPAGVWHSMASLMVSTGSVHSRPPTVTVLSLVRFSPVTVMVSSPVTSPLLGVTPVMVGGLR